MRMHRENATLVVTMAVIIAMSFIVSYAGHFLLAPDGQNMGKTSQGAMATGKTGRAGAMTEASGELPVKYTHMSITVNGSKQEIHVLEIKVWDRRVKVKPVLSHDSVFGFEYLSSMAERNKAYAAVNAGFFYEFGQPSGMVMVDGMIYAGPTGRFPVLIIKSGEAMLDDFKMEVSAVLTRHWANDGIGRFRVDRVNTDGFPGEIVLYTPAYGSENRLNAGNVTAVVRNGTVVEIVESAAGCAIPGDGFLLTYIKSAGSGKQDMPLRPGDHVEIRLEPDQGKDAQVYECGSWIVRDGNVVIGDWDEWVGTMENNDPRTAVGIKEDGTLLLVVVDGRQPGYSAGMTGRELGEFLRECGAKDAAMLDGGASSEMIVEGRIVNRPSFKGQERMLGGGIVVQLDAGSR